MKTYRQVELLKHDGPRSLPRVVGWIDSEKALKGWYAEIPELGGSWFIVEVYDFELTEEQLRWKQSADRQGLPSISS